MPLPAIAVIGGGIALLGGGAYLAQEAIKFIERNVRSQEQKELLDKTITTARATETGQVVKTEAPVYQEALKYAQKEEEKFLEQTPEVPIASDVSKALGWGKTTVGGAFSGIGLPRFLPESASVVGGGYFERQEANIKNYLINEGIQKEQAEKEAKILKSVGTFESATIGVPVVAVEVGGGLLGKVAKPVIAPVVKNVLPKATEPIQKIAVSAGSSFVGAFGESFGQTGYVASRQDATLKDVPGLGLQAVAGGIVGGAISAPINVGYTAGSVVKPKYNILGSGLQKTSSAIGQLVDPVAETLGDVAESKLRLKVFTPGVSSNNFSSPFSSPSTTNLQTKSPVDIQTKLPIDIQIKTPVNVETKVKAYIDTKSKTNFSLGFEKTNDNENTKKKQDDDGDTRKEPDTDKDMKDKTDNDKFNTREPVKSNINIFSDVSTRAIVPNKPYNNLFGLALPFIGTATKPGRLATKKYINELSLLPSALGKQVGVAKKVLRQNANININFQQKKPQKNIFEFKKSNVRGVRLDFGFSKRRKR